MSSPEVAGEPRRLSLLGVLDEVVAFLGLEGQAVRRAVASIAGAERAWWDCVVCEVHPGGAPTAPRVDVMAAVTRHGPPLPAAHLVAGAAPLAWLEWDIVDGRAADPLESICVSGAILGPLELSAPRAAELRRDALERLAPRGAAPAYLAQLERCLAAPGAHELIHVASLAPRGLPHLRLTWRVRAMDLCAWLVAIGWPGEVAALPPVLASVVWPFDTVGVQLELEPRLGPYLGVETHEFRAAAPAHAHLPHLLDGISRHAGPSPWAARLVGWPGTAELAAHGPVLRHAYTKLVPGPAGRWLSKHYLGITTATVAASMDEVARQRAAR